MSACPSCQADNLAGARFCAACGTNLAHACGQCGSPLPEEARFCPSCGAASQPVVEAERQRKVISVVFADLVGYTALSEVTDAEDVRELLERYYGLVSAEIERFGGSVEKFIGDAVMAVFGAPVSRGDDAERAVRAALEIPTTVRALNEETPGVQLEVRVGVNTGEAVVELDPSAEDTAIVIGDMVNTASRLQSAAPVGRVLVGQETYAATHRAILYEPVEPIVAKNKQDPVPAWIAVEPLSGFAQRPSGSPFMGRASELGLLADIWRRVERDRRPHLITILGDPGIGKSRLAEELAGIITASEGRSFEVRELPYTQSSGYEAFGQLVRDVAGIFELDPDHVTTEKLSRSLEAMGLEDIEVVKRLSVFAGTGDSPAEDRREVFDAARRFVEALGHERPSLLVFDDIHWAHPSMLDLIESLAAHTKHAPVMLLCLARTELLDIRPMWGGGLASSFTIKLEPLPSDDAHALALRLTSRLTGEIAGQIEVTAGGNPLFIEELASWVAEGGDHAALPNTVRAMIAARLDALPKEERSVVNDAAVIGKVFWRGVLAELGSRGADLEAALESLESRDVIRHEPSSKVEGDSEYTFRHILIRDVAYSTLTRAARRERHRAVAEFFERSLPNAESLAAILAHHWKEAGDPERAVSYLLAAAERAELGWANAEAVALYEEALASIPRTEEARRRSISLRRGVAWSRYEHSISDEASLRRSAREDLTTPE